MNIYQHFRPEEHAFIDQVINWKDQVETTYAPRLTDFLDPREQQIVKLLIGTQADVQVHFFGGAEEMERQRVILAPDYYEVQEHDFLISLLEINYPSKFVTIEHRHLLGSLMSLGLKRGKYGDILVDGEQIQVLVASEIAPYVMSELKEVGRAKVQIQERSVREAIKVREKWEEHSCTVSSMRLDAIVATIYNLARQKAQNLITHGLVKVNWTVVENSSFDCREGDMISVRGYGRAKIQSIDGKTKKEKWRIVVFVQK